MPRSNGGSGNEHRVARGRGTRARATRACALDHRASDPVKIRARLGESIVATQTLRLELVWSDAFAGSAWRRLVTRPIHQTKDPKCGDYGVERCTVARVFSST